MRRKTAGSVRSKTIAMVANLDPSNARAGDARIDSTLP
jgi:hypothetical protein